MIKDLLPRELEMNLRDIDSALDYEQPSDSDMMILHLLLDHSRYRQIISANVDYRMFLNRYARASFLLLNHLYKIGSIDYMAAVQEANEFGFAFFERCINDIYAFTPFNFPNDATVLEWCRKRKDAYLERRLGDNLKVHGMSKALEIHNMLDSEMQIGLSVELESSMDGAIERQIDYQNRRRANGGIEGFRTFDWMDRACGGLMKNDLSVIASRPGGFKTGLGINLAMKAVAVDKNVRVCFLNLEMPETQMTPRFVQAFHKMSKEQYENMSPGIQRDALKEVFEENRLISTKTMHLDNQELVSVLDYYHSIGVRLFFIDYLQLIKSKTQYGNRDDLRIRDAIDSIKLWKDKVNDSHICCLAQLKRMEGKRVPTMDDLKGSSYIEEASAMIMMMYSDKDVVTKKEAAELDVNDTRPERLHAWFAKNRHKATGSLSIVVNKSKMQVFESDEATDWMKKNAAKPKKDKPLGKEFGWVKQ